MQVQLTPHVGQMGNTDGTTTEVEFHQDLIYVDGSYVGLWPKQPGSPLLLVRNVPESHWSALAASCAQLRGQDDLPMINGSYAALVAHKAAVDGAEDDDD
jgi:hypothetical protein